VKTAGVAFDFYDDPNGAVLRSKFPRMEDLPPMIKEATFLTPEQRDALPDDHYALVMLNGEEKMRKFAMIDPAHTALSVVYFLENRHTLPEDATKTAASRLAAACTHFNIQPPALLLAESGEKLAELWPSSALRRLTNQGESAGAAPCGPGDKPYSDYFVTPELKAQAQQLSDQDAALDLQREQLNLQQDQLRVNAKTLELQQVQMAQQAPVQPVPAEAAPVEAAPLKEEKPKEKSDKASKTHEKVAALIVNYRLRRMVDPPPKRDRDIDKPFPSYFQNPELRAEAESLEAMDEALGVKEEAQRLERDKLDLLRQGLRLKQRKLEIAQMAEMNSSPAKVASSPYVDVAGKEAPIRVLEKTAAAPDDCLLVLDGVPRFPVRDYGEAEKAASYFMQNMAAFSPDRRRQFCTNLAHRAHAWGMSLPDEIEKYASDEVDPFRQVYFDARKAFIVDPSVHDQLDKLCKMAAALDPDVAAMLQRMVIMGGVFFQTEGLEWNIRCDPHAAAVVFAAPVPEVHVCGLDVTKKCRMSADECRERLQGGPLDVVAQMAEVWFRRAEAITFHDPLAGCCVFEPELCTWRRGHVTVAHEDPESPGLTQLAQDESGTHLVAEDVDADGFFGRYFRTVGVFR